MKYSTECHHCGHRISAYSVNLNALMAKAFLQFVELYLEKRGVINIYKELDFSHTQNDNFQKLKHLGIIQMVEGQGWVPTPLGLRFYWGVETILNPGGQMGNETLPDDHPAWETHKTERKLIFLRDVLGDYEIKQRADYQAEASPQMPLC